MAREDFRLSRLKQQKFEVDYGVQKKSNLGRSCV